MTHLFGRAVRCLPIAAALVLLSAPAAQAHPHVWITARAELMFGPDGALTGIRHAWTFDEMTSSQQVMGIDGKTKGQLSRDELADKAKDSIEGLKEFRYFTYLKAGGSKLKFADPVDYYLEQKDELVTMTFVLPLKAPSQAKDLALEVYDPSFFIEITFDDKEPVKLTGAPAGCKATLQRPNDGSADAQRMNEQNFLNGDTSNYGAMYANKIAVTCP